MLHCDLISIISISCLDVDNFTDNQGHFFSKIVSFHSLSDFFLNPGDCGDHVVIMNTRHIAFSGNKWEQKVYSSHTG